MRIALFIFFVFCAFSISAQQGPQLILPEEDSIHVESPNPALLSPVLQPGIMNQQLFPDFQSMQFNDQLENWKRFNLNRSLFEMPQVNYIPEISLTAFSPFYTNAKIFGGSATKLNEKITVGGFSYGTNSIFSAPNPNQNNSYFDTYGSTMFMEYKVSKNIKIETRVSVGHSNQGPPPPPGR